MNNALMLDNYPTLELLARTLHLTGVKIGWTNGCFDMFHAGHAYTLRCAHELCDFLIVGLNGDDSVARHKGPGRPIIPQDDRASILRACRYVDAIFVFDEDTPHKAIEVVLPDVLIKGGDYTGQRIVGQDIVEAAGGIVRYVPYSDLPMHNTTNIEKKIRETSHLDRK